MEFFPVGKIYDFMSQRRLFVGLSLVLVLGSLALFFLKGPKLGTDFRGGTEVELAFKKPVEAGAVRQAVQKSGFATPDVIAVEDAVNPNRYLVRVKEVTAIDEDTRSRIDRLLCLGEGLSKDECPEQYQATEVRYSPGGDKITVRFRGPPDLDRIRERMQQVSSVSLRTGQNNPSIQNVREHRVEIQLMSKGDQLIEGLRSTLGAEVVPDRALRVEWIGPKAGAQLRDSALKSIAIALVFIMAYIAFRFDLRFAPGAVVSLTHDAIVTVGVLVLLNKELNLTTVAAILTIVGYSVNDTVVVYDRVRENFGKLRGSSFLHLINVSLSEMMSRTILTSGTTIVSLVAFFVWGTGALKEFSLTLIIGLVLGTYSSIYVALPITEWLDRTFFKRMDDRKRSRIQARAEKLSVAQP
jgi:preprotein translocase subunit SecF